MPYEKKKNVPKNLACQMNNFTTLGMNHDAYEPVENIRKGEEERSELLSHIRT